MGSLATREPPRDLRVYVAMSQRRLGIVLLSMMGLGFIYILFISMTPWWLDLAFLALIVVPGLLGVRAFKSTQPK